MSRKQVATLISFVFNINSTNDLTSASLNLFKWKTNNQIYVKNTNEFWNKFYFKPAYILKAEYNLNSCRSKCGVDLLL